MLCMLCVLIKTDGVSFDHETALSSPASQCTLTLCSDSNIAAVATLLLTLRLLLLSLVLLLFLC